MLSKSAKHMERQHLGVHRLDDAAHLEIGQFCDSGMKCFGQHDLFQQLASFLHRNTAVKLYSSGKTFKSLVEGKFSGLLLRLAMTSAFEEHHVRKLQCFKSIPLRIRNAQELLHIMHELSRVLQNGLNLHRREPGASWHLTRCVMDHVKPSRHLTWHNVGILMATREQYLKALASRMRLDLEWIRWKRQILRRELRYDA